jgi:endonuclease/exonuclease/phosphatase family metal-dependent hydrolase
MAGTVSIGEQQLRIFNAHVDPHAAANGQLAQLEVIAEQAAISSLPYNHSRRLQYSVRKEMQRDTTLYRSREVTSPPSLPEQQHGVALESVYMLTGSSRRDVVVERWGVAKPLNVSDHWPVWAEISLSDSAN